MTIFEKIISGEIPSYKIAEDENYIAFLDAFPLKEGHALVVPKKAVDYIFDLDEEQFIGLHLFSRRVAKAMMKVIACKRIGTAVIGLEVPHTHIHLIPIDAIGDVSFSNPKLKIEADVMKTIASKIADVFE